MRLVARHWVITDGNGGVKEVRGEGVVGSQPLLMPGESFAYQSACPLSTQLAVCMVATRWFAKMVRALRQKSHPSRWRRLVRLIECLRPPRDSYNEVVEHLCPAFSHLAREGFCVGRAGALAPRRGRSQWLRVASEQMFRRGRWHPEATYSQSIY